MPTNKSEADNHVFALTVSHRHPGKVADRSDHCGAENGVRDTLRELEIAEGRLNNTLKIGSDLIKSPEHQIKLSDILANRMLDAFAHLTVQGDAQCQA